MALQLGGDDPQRLAAAARIAEDLGYDEINLNVGCPSDRVQQGRFGACLMREPALVAECVAAMRAAVKVPVTVKHRIGVDDLDRYEACWPSSTVVARRRLKTLRRPRPQGLAGRPVAQGEPRRPAAALRRGLPAQARAAGI